METLLSIFAEIDDPRDHTAQYTLSAMLFIALAATLCGATAWTEVADYAEANLTALSEIVVGTLAQLMRGQHGLVVLLLVLHDYSKRK